MRLDHTPQTMQYMMEAASTAQGALCLNAKCGAVIVRDGEIVGRGYNAPPLDNPAHRMCDVPYDGAGKPKYDHTCCIHAEWRAIMDALRRAPDKVVGSQLFFARVDEAGAIIASGKPYCTVCSRLALDAGITEFYLWHEEGITSYPTDEYNALSYQYRVG